jgi:hypothetical protein
MTLTTHAIVGASVASILPSHPALGFAAGFVSHFLLDAIPHWDYYLISRKKDNSNPMNNDIILNKYFIFDLFKIGTDAILGVVIALLLFGISNFHLVWAPLWGIVGALTPDALQFIYFKWRHEPMISLQRFHLWVHQNDKLNNRPVLGISLQIIIIVLVIVISKFYFLRYCF